MADKNVNNPRDINIDDVRKLNQSFISGLDALPSQSTTPANRQDIETIDKRINSVIKSELNNTKSITSDDMGLFLVKLFNEQERDRIKEYNSVEDIFQGTDESLVQFFQDRYHNKNVLYEDFNMITTQLFEMDEAVLTTRDAIITSDDVSQTVSATLKFSNTPETDDIAANHIESIRGMEDELKLPTKIKNTIIPNTLKYGEYYVYTIPYSKLFEQEYRFKIENPNYVNEHTVEIVSESADDKAATASLANDINDVYGGAKYTKPSLVSEAMKNFNDSVHVYNDICSIPLIEGVSVSDLLDTEKFNKKVKAATDGNQGSTTFSSDGVIDAGAKVKGKFDQINDVYIKYIDPRKLIPVQILNTTIGYYYIHDTELRVNKAPFATSIRVTTTGISGNTKYNEDVERMFISRITDKVVNAFDHKFLQNNQKFKELILNSLMYNDMYKKEIKFQFIPAEYITRFTVNEDEEGNGTSILSRSLFYARLYLSLLIFNMISIITRSNDTRIWYIKNSGIDANITNKVQEVARSIKAKQINFMDLLNYNSIISKIGQYKEIFMPLGRSGERAIDFDTLQGQDVQINNDLMEMLRSNMISGTGVPSVIMNYINEADYAKTLQMANSKFVGRVVSLQLDFNPQITELYRKIIRYSGLQVPPEYIDKFLYILNAPKSLNNNNIADMLGAADNLASSLVKITIGDADNDDETAVIKDIAYKKLMQQYMPMLDWNAIYEMVEKSKIEAKQKMLEKPSQS